MKQKYFALLLLSTSSTLTFSASFFDWQQSGSSIADYAAGAASSITDPDVAYYNPAGMAFFDAQTLGVSAIGAIEKVRYKGSVSFTDTNLNPAITDSGTSNGGENGVGGTLMYIAPISDKWAFGLSIDSPFGNATDFGYTSQVRYNTTKNNVFSTETSPSLSYKITPDFSVAAGIDYLYASATINQVTTFNNIRGIATASNIYASGHSWGWHTGLLWRVDPKTNIGLSFRSQFHLSASGPSEIVGNNDIPADYSRAYSSVTLPSITTLSAQHQFGSRWTIMGTTTYTLWSSFNRFVLNNVAGTEGQTIVLPEAYRNTWQFIAGAHYRATSKLRVLGGLGFDQSPIRAQYRDITAPDNNHIITSIGMGYQFTKNMDLTAGWSHYFIKQANINFTKDFAGSLITSTGDIDSSANVFGLQLDWKFT